MAVYNPASLHAEEFINDAEIRETLAYAEENKNNMGNNDSVNVGVVCSCNWVESLPYTVLV